jgi:hypothetical protein
MEAAAAIDPAPEREEEADRVPRRDEEERDPDPEREVEAFSRTAALAAR